MILSVALYFVIFLLMSEPFYKSDVLLGTFDHAMADPDAYLGMLLLIGFLYLVEKITGFFTR